MMIMYILVCLTKLKSHISINVLLTCLSWLSQCPCLLFNVDKTPEQPREEEDDIVWFAEAFQIILKKQVDALINMGVTDRLKVSNK